MELKEDVLKELGTLIRCEGISSPRSPVRKEVTLRTMESTLGLLTTKARYKGYRKARYKAQSLDMRHVEDLERLLDKEEKERKELQEEKSRMGEEVRGIVREEMQRVAGT